MYLLQREKRAQGCLFILGTKSLLLPKLQISLLLFGEWLSGGNPTLHLKTDCTDTAAFQECDSTGMLYHLLQRWHLFPFVHYQGLRYHELTWGCCLRLRSARENCTATPVTHGHRYAELIPPPYSCGFSTNHLNWLAVLRPRHCEWEPLEMVGVFL